MVVTNGSQQVDTPRRRRRHLRDRVRGPVSSGDGDDLVDGSSLTRRGATARLSAPERPLHRGPGSDASTPDPRSTSTRSTPSGRHRDRHRLPRLRPRRGVLGTGRHRERRRRPDGPRHPAVEGRPGPGCRPRRRLGQLDRHPGHVGGRRRDRHRAQTIALGGRPTLTMKASPVPRRRPGRPRVLLLRRERPRRAAAHGVLGGDAPHRRHGRRRRRRALLLLRPPRSGRSTYAGGPGATSSSSRCPTRSTSTSTCSAGASPSARAATRSRSPRRASRTRP